MLPIPAHVEVMEALRMAGGNDALVEEMKLWLLKQKQTVSWNSPVATADAVYALLCQGTNLLESRGDVRITLGNEVLETLSPAKTIIPDLGYVKETFIQGSPELKAKTVTVEKRDAGIAWGAVYAQYLSPISDVKQQGGELNVEKKLYVERISAGGSKSLQPVTEGTVLSVGDKIVARLTIRLDRTMDFVQLKDQRGACFEPIGSLSGYRWSNGLGYYAEVEDAGTNFFFDHLGKGFYVLEHSYRIARGGTKELNIVVKGDVDGSVEALSDSLEKLSTDKIKVSVILKSVGQISENDVALAAASQAIIIGFQVRPSVLAKKQADQQGVEIRLYSIIYDAIGEVKLAMEGMLEPVVKEEVTATIEVRQVFHISKVGFVAGAFVSEGKVSRSDKARLIRDGIVIQTANIAALKRFKDDVKEVGANFECGISLANCNDLKEGDVIETFKQVEVKATL